MALRVTGPATFAWDDIRFFLAAVDAGSMNAAGTLLRVAHTTVSRRIHELERRLQTTLFFRGGSGLTLTVEGERALELARQMETVAQNFSNEISSCNGNLSGILRVEATRGLGSLWLMPRLTAFEELHPNLHIEWSFIDVKWSRIGQDVDLQLIWERPTGDNLQCVKIAEIPYFVYGTRNYFLRHGSPSSLMELKDHKVLHQRGFEKNNSGRFKSWNDHVSHHGAAKTISDISSIHQILRQDNLLTLLPSYATDLMPDLIASPLDMGIILEVWAVFHKSVISNRRLSAVLGEIKKVTKALNSKQPSELIDR